MNCVVYRFDHFLARKAILPIRNCVILDPSFDENASMNFFKKLIFLMTLLVHLGVYCVAASGQCARDQFRCDNGQCIRMLSVCDYHADCNDESDERECNSENHPKCGKGYFQCVSSKSCVQSSWLCDEDWDCADGSDEQNCTVPLCGARRFLCLNNRHCIDMMLRCDGSIDCDDSSDEMHCHGYARNCLNQQFPCETEHRCVSREWLCDGEHDCGDRSDEKNCDDISSSSTTPAATPTKTTEESCPDNYCMQNADCIVVNGQYYCDCTPSFTGEKCEMSITAERNSHDLGIVIGISMTLIILFISIALMLIYYCKRRSARRATALVSKDQMPFTSYSKE